MLPAGRCKVTHAAHTRFVALQPTLIRFVTDLFAKEVIRLPFSGSGASHRFSHTRQFLIHIRSTRCLRKRGVESG